MVLPRLLTATGFLLLAVTTASAIQSTLSIELGEDQLGDFDRKVVNYTCATGEPFAVQYINAAPNFLALVPIEADKLIMSAVASADGSTKYVAGHWVWWSKGNEARLYDLTQGDKAAPLNTCTELNETP
ncbi:MliC family protein [Devosia sp.]|uniref:MliC family protein n=1 Tax=Devosia sp. TaxID=1871048 RepID=UPI0032671582